MAATPAPIPADLRSAAQRFSALSRAERARRLDQLDPHELAALEFEWRDWWARGKQTAPSFDLDWRVWLILAGRGFGKTRVGAETVREAVEKGVAKRIALIGATAGDTRDVMIEGESGILACSPPWFRPKYEPSKRRVTWPNGAVATAFSADEPDRLRGPQHDFAWCDELAAWRYPDAWDQMEFGLRLGTSPRAVVTTTPRPIPLVRTLLADSSTILTRGSMNENRSNLAASFISKIEKKYGGTRLGRQEIDAELLEDVQGALWKRAQIEELRVRALPKLLRVVVAIDPAVTSADGSDETGIVVAGVGPPPGHDPKKPLRKEDLHGYVLDDLSGRMSPNEWGKKAVGAFKTQKADRIVAEVNNGGDLVEQNIRTVDHRVPYLAVHASRGKRTRAEPISALYEQGKVHHVGTLPQLEDQMATWDASAGEKSPDRLDALVWALTALMLPESLPPPRGRVPLRAP